MIKLFSLILFSTFLSKAWAYPEMVTHGYGNCISCHASPTGGGLLTPYGRALSKELLSMKSDSKGNSGSEQFLYNSVHLPKNLQVGGDVRFLQMFLENQYESSGRAIFMQADLEAMYSFSKKTRVLVSAGRQDVAKAQKAMDQFISRRHWINFLIGSEDNIEKHQLRLGRFFPAYGLNVPEHTLQIKRGLGFDQSQETYNAEYAYIGDNWNIFSTLITGRPDKKELQKEEGGAIQASYTYQSKNKIGASFYTGLAPNKSSSDRKTLMGIYSIYSFTPKLFSLFELDRSFIPRKNYGLYEYLKLGYNYTQGLTLYLAGEYSRPSIYQANNTLKSFSLGIQVFPWVHWEFEAYIKREENMLTQNYKNNLAVLQAHLYL